MKKLTTIITGIAVLVLIISISRCSKSSSTAPPPKQVKLQTSATLGNYLTDKDGRTIYFFANDANGQSSCTGGCETLWSVFYVDNLTIDQLGDTSLHIADFAIITTSSGKRQFTYKGWPMYQYNPGGTPEAAGQTTGDAFAGVWFVAKPDYTIMLTNNQLIGADNNHYKSDYTVGDAKTVYFTDGSGNTLYTFKKDSANHNKFTKSDFSNNTTFALDENTKIVVPSIIDKTQFSLTDVFGRKQLSYKGWPLYYFGADGGVRGTNKGVSFGAVGIWPVAIKDAVAAPHL